MFASRSTGVERLKTTESDTLATLYRKVRRRRFAWWVVGHLIWKRGKDWEQVLRLRSDFGPSMPKRTWARWISAYTFWREFSPGTSRFSSDWNRSAQEPDRLASVLRKVKARG